MSISKDLTPLRKPKIIAVDVSSFRRLRVTFLSLEHNSTEKSVKKNNYYILVWKKIKDSRDEIAKNNMVQNITDREL